MAPPLVRLAAAVALAAGTAACVDDASVTVKYADGYTPGHTAVSMLGVFRDGRMSVDSWRPLAPLLSTAFGNASADLCEPAFGERLQHENEELFASIDDEVRNNGITEDLLTKLAPRAQGEMILTVSVHGSIGQTGTDKQRGGTAGTPPMTSPRRGGPGGGAGRGARGGPMRESPARGSGVRPLELSASLYSVRLKTPVAHLSMSYTGQSIEEALRRFATEIGAMAPGSTCRGWTFPTSTPAAVAPLLEGP